MAKRKLPEPETFALRTGTASGCDEVKVIGPSERTYVWIGKDGEHVCNFSGPATLRKFAKSILRELGNAGKKS